MHLLEILTLQNKFYRIEINLIDHDSSSSVVEAINSMPQLPVLLHGQSLLGEALLEIGQIFKQEELGSRMQTSKVRHSIGLSLLHLKQSIAFLTCLNCFNLILVV